MDYNVYNYFIGNYAQKPATKYDTHKSSELRSVMKNIHQDDPVIARSIWCACLRRSREYALQY